MTVKRTLLGFAIEGVGLDTSVSDGVVLCYGTHTPTFADYEFVECLTALPASPEDAINPFDGTWSASSVTFRLDASDRLASLLLRDGAILEEVSADVTDSATTIPLGVKGLEDDVIWIGDEAILLGTFDVGNAQYTGCTRGYWDTRARAISEGAAVFDHVPYWDTRLVKLIEHDVDAGTVTTRQRYIIRDISMDGPQIVVQTEAILVALANARVNKDAPNYRRSLRVDEDGQTRGTIQQIRPSVLDAYAFGDTAFVQVGDACYKTQATVTLRPPRRDEALFDSAPPRGEPTGPLDVYELFVVARADGESSLAELSQPYHPLAIALALLTSTGTADNGTYDVLSARWGLGIDFLDWTVWTDEIAATTELVVDQLVLGWDGEEVDVLGVIQDQLLRPFGYFLAQTVTGLIGLGKLRLLSIGDIDGASSNTIRPYYPGPLRMSRAFRDTTGEVRATIGELPFRDGKEVTVREPTRSSRRGLLGHTRKHRLDLSVISADAVQNQGRGGADEEVSSLVSLLQLQLDTAPRLTIRVADYAIESRDYDLGAIVQLSDIGGERAWLVGPDGSRVADSDLDLAQYHGMIISRRWIIGDQTSEHAYDLTVLLINYYRGDYIRERAPACLVDEYTSGDEFEVDVGQFGFTGHVNTLFAVGDEIELWTRDGERRAISEVVVVDGFPSSTTIEYTPSLTDAPVAGQVVRLAESTQYSNTAHYSFDDRPFTFLADVDETIDVGASDDPADIFGTQVLTRSDATPTNIAYNGSDFYVLHDDLVALDGDGSQPLDSFVAMALQNNERWLIVNGEQISWVPHVQNGGDYDDEAGIRAYASSRWSTILHVPWLISAGLASATASVCARAGDESSGTVAVDHRVRVLDSLGDLLGEETAQVTQETAPEFHDYTLTASLSRIPQRQDIGVLSYDVLSSVDTADESVASNSTVAVSSAIQIANEFADTSSTRPNGGAFDLQCSFTGDDSSTYDHIIVSPDIGDGDDAMEVYPRPLEFADFARKQLGYLQVRGVEIFTQYDDLTALSNASHRSRIPVLGETEATHPVRTDQAYLRPRCVYVGPVGDAPSSGGWPTGYVRRWEYVNALTSGGNGVLTTWFRTEFLLDTINPDLLTLLHVIPVYAEVDGTITNNLSDVQSLEVGWSFRCVVEQLDDGDTAWSGATELSTAADETDLTLTHYYKNDRGGWPFLQHMRRYSGTLAGGTSPGTATNYTYREGQLFAPDLDLIQLVPITVSVSNDTTRVTRPVRATIQVTVDTGTLSADIDPTYLELVCVGASQWEVPT